ncbi:hypothetical protein F5148DRAFT_1165743 [Russula earlei]|uniref:Uncharacterized protein n=1 Tax=Russula earlei TaxID=71964 RepID=A0ACC0UJX8_9AGAM|nr:hypothetical protein F5148DRAFT_1165743 [Russula earlei]
MFEPSVWSDGPNCPFFYFSSVLQANINVPCPITFSMVYRFCSDDAIPVAIIGICYQPSTSLHVSLIVDGTKGPSFFIPAHLSLLGALHKSATLNSTGPYWRNISDPHHSHMSFHPKNPYGPHPPFPAPAHADYTRPHPSMPIPNFKEKQKVRVRVTADKWVIGIIISVVYICSMFTPIKYLVEFESVDGSGQRQRGEFSNEDVVPYGPGG